MRGRKKGGVLTTRHHVGDYCSWLDGMELQA